MAVFDRWMASTTSMVVVSILSMSPANSQVARKYLPSGDQSAWLTPPKLIDFICDLQKDWIGVDLIFCHVVRS